MANLGTLWFGADIDLTALRNKVLKGNESILNALKMDYDPASYQQMVSKIRTALDRETFEIKINANAQSIRQNLQSTINSVSGGIKTPTMDLSGLKGIAGMRSQMASLTEEIILQEEKTRLLKRAWKDMSSQYGRSSTQAQAAYRAYRDASESAKVMRTNSGLLGVDIRRASLAQAELNKQTREAAKATREWTADHMRLNATLAGGVHISTQLGSALSSLFAIDYARQFLGNVIEIGGQLEKQRISIGAILGDTVKASHLFEQIKGLALQSPFGVVELDQYTKQLSAYGFRYNELYDMTKRLADISAGAGTDIGRLTLALGHVRSATYLTGITLRQFSMNNIPMLKMLADYYTEVEKKAVSTAEVQQRISKRQVSYEDVIEQIRRLTDEGGMFYNMQEKISESLAARYKNLKDAMDIMYGEMAEGTVGDMLKGLASTLLQLTRHWKEIANVMGVAAAAFMIGKIRIGLSTVAMQGNTAATIKQILTTKQLEANNLKAAASYRALTQVEQGKIASSRRLTAQDISQAIATNQLTKDEVLNAIALKQVHAAEAQALVTTGLLTKAEVDAALATNAWSARLSVLGGKIKNAFAGIGWGTLSTIGLMVGMELYSAWDQWNQRIDDKSNEMKDLIKSRIIDLQKMQKELDTNGKPSDQTSLKGRIDEMKQVLANSEAYTKTLDEQLSKAGDLPKQYDILADAINNTVEKNRQMLDYQDRVAKMIKGSTGDFSSWDFKENLDWLTNDDITKNISQTLDAYKDLRAVIDGAWEYKEAIKSVIEEMLNSNKVSEDFKEQLRNAPFEEQIRLLAESGYWQQVKDKITSLHPDFLNFANKIIEASNGVTERWDEIANDDIPRMLKTEAERRGISEEELNRWCLENIDDFKMMLDGINDQLGIKEPEIRKRLKRLFYDYVRFSEMQASLNEGAKLGASMFSTFTDEKLQKLLEENETTDIKDSTKGDTTTKGDKKDKKLEEAKTRLQEYKAFLSEYKKYKELYSKEKAIDLLEQLFPNLKGQGSNLVDNYAAMLDKLRDSLELNTDARKKWANEVNKTKADTLFDQEKDAIKRNADAMDEYTSRMEEQWKLYRSLLKKSGGNRELAQLAFNNNGVIWDDTAKEMLTKFNERGNELGVIPIGFHWNMNEQEMKEALVNAKGEVQTELVKLALKIQKIIRGNYSKLLEDASEAYSQTLTSAEKLLNLERELADLEKERSQYNGDDKGTIKAMDVKIEAKKRELEQARIDAFKESSDYLNFYNAILSLTIPEAEKIGRKIKENLNDELKRGKLSARQYLTEIKRINEQLDKLRNGHSNLKSFISGGLNGLLQNMKDLGDNKWQRGVNDMQQAEKDFEQAVKMYNTAQSEGNQQLMDAADSQMQASQSSMEGAKAMQKSGAAMSEGASSAMQTVAVIDMIVHGINDVVQGVKTAFDDIRETFKAAGRDTDTDSWNDWGTFLNSFSSASNSATSAWDSLKNGNIGGVISGVVGSFTGWYKGIAQGWDKKMDRQIELAGRQIKATERMRTTMERGLKRTLGSVYNYKTSQQNIEKLTEARNKTEWVDEKTYSERWRDSATGAIKGALYGLTAEIYKNNIVKLFAEGLSSKKYKTNYYNADTIAAMDKAIQSQTYYDEQYALLFKQRDELQHQLAAEQDKKDTNNEKVEDYKAQLEEIQDQIENFAEDFAKAIYDIDVRSWASELGDALFEAWQKGESGAEAFKKKASEIIAELAKNIAVVKLVETAMQPVLDVITDQMAKKSGKLDTESVELIAEVMNTVGEKLPDSFNNLMDGLNEGIKRAGLTDMKELNNDNSSSMSSSIKSITEQTADLLASYINAIRADVSVIRATQAVYLPTLSTDIHTTSVLAQTQVTLQQQIAANTLRNAEAADKIYEIMHKIDTGVTKVRIA